MAEGYIKGRPDLTWWMDQIRAGELYRQKEAFQTDWERWRRYYKGQFRKGVLPVNIFYSMVRTLVPRVYFRNPAVSVRPSMPGYINMAFALVLNRIDNKLIDGMDLKGAAKDMVQDSFFMGTGIGKLGYGGEFTSSPGFMGPVSAPVGKGGEFLEYSSNVYADMPWFMRISARNFVVPDRCRRISEARWVAHKIRRPTDDVKSDKRLRNTESLVGYVDDTSYAGSSIMRRLDEIDLYEVRDRKYQRVFVFSPNAGGGRLLLDPEQDKLQERRHPFFPLVLNPDSDCFWGLPDAKILEPHQLELNEINTQIMKHRRLSLIKFLFEQGNITEDELAKMVSEDVGAAISVNDISKIIHWQVANIPQDLIQAKQLVIQDVRDAIGFSRNQMGEYQSRRGDTSATEASIVQQGSEIRVDERRDAMADLIRDMIVEMNEIIFDKWDEQMIVDVVGPGGVPIWVSIQPSMLKAGRYNVKVDPDSVATRSRESREAKAAALYTLLKTNPLIDPVKLTQYLLTEIDGVELDDLMRILPPPEAGGPTGVLNPAQFAGVVQQSMGNMQGKGQQASIPSESGGEQ